MNTPALSSHHIIGTVQALALYGVVLLFSGCDGKPAADASLDPVQEPASTGQRDPQNLPPSFLDEPPAPPVSDTFILSGGTLVTDEDLFDAVVVVQGNRVIAAGKRGEVPVPPDSIGIDASGKFIVADDTEVTLIGGPANLTVFDSHPSKSEGATVFARVADGQWQPRE